MAAVVAAAVALAPNERVTGPLSGDDKVGIYTAILDDRYVAAPATTGRFLVDARDELDDGQRRLLSLRYPATWLPLDGIDIRSEAPGSVLIEVLYPATIAHGRVTVQLAEMCGHRCGSGTSYELTRAGAGWRIVDQTSAVSA
ncbi:MAG: hypothetical protein QOG52_2233 [Frankiaceae bacterium]|jgi:hypothetical protein|nr:hypothetical protein [Frankiaceae bacterium]